MPEKGCFMLEPGPVPGLFSAVDGLDEDHVVETPENFHVTLLYGVTEPVAPPDAVAWWKLSRTFGEIKDAAPRTLAIDRELTLFENDEFDVLKADVRDDGLSDLHQLVKESYETDVEFSFSPHMTVAYLEPGTGQQYTSESLGVDWVDVVGVSYNGPETSERITRRFSEI